MALDNASTHAVFDTLLELGPASVPVLEEVVRSDSSNGWWAVQAKFDESIVVLGWLGPAAREAAPVLRDGKVAAAGNAGSGYRRPRANRSTSAGTRASTTKL